MKESSNIHVIMLQGPMPQNRCHMGFMECLEYKSMLGISAEAFNFQNLLTQRWSTMMLNMADGINNM